MRELGTTRVLLLANEFHSPLAVRHVARRAGLDLDLEQVASREEFFSKLWNAPPALILANIKGLANLALPEILEHAGGLEFPVPVVVTGDEAPSSATALEAVRCGAVDYVRSTDLGRLPLVIDRTLRATEMQAGRDRAHLEMERAAQVLRDNHKLVTSGRLAASIAHEINNPLEAISNLLFLLHSEKGLSEDAQKYLSLAQRELDRVVQISKQTLTFHRETKTPVRVRPADLLDEVLALYTRGIGEKQLLVVRQYKSDQQLTLFPGEMRQAFSNLIANAIQASALRGRIWVRVQNGRQWSDHNIKGLRISVGDSGSGIPLAARQHLGEPFFTTKGQKGTGLGLWVTQSIIQRYGGTLQLQSSTDARRHGTVFSIFLPTNMRPQPVLPAVGGVPSGSSPGSGESAKRKQVASGEVNHALSQLRAMC